MLPLPSRELYIHGVYIKCDSRIALATLVQAGYIFNLLPSYKPFIERRMLSWLVGLLILYVIAARDMRWDTLLLGEK